MIRFFTLLFCFLFTTALAQEKDCVNDFYARKKIIELMLKSYRRVYDFHKEENIASIGSGSGNREVIYSMMADSLTFYVQDINPICLEPDILSATIRRLYAVMNRSCTAKFISIRGKAKETRLPDKVFDKVIVENSLHEFESPVDMLKSIRGNLKRDGYLFISELIAKRPGKKHIDCRKPLFTEQSLVKLLDESGFRLKATETVHPFDDYDKVYKFEIKE
ncbi:methyltransferase domain-containing protein [Spirosoma endbachense]|uniref:Methyltransferase domain-containing protein n=1 Tax=Spirosoma endbachense TaxID=2666025 RepID=A0A6P1W125_9BACT|nr:methyltransferase domain-containing protein [Spirosoma endbachense]QHV97689.1 methyltransferase domain-containing protein [Spirosoma endbachense]